MTIRDTQKRLARRLRKDALHHSQRDPDRLRRTGALGRPRSAPPDAQVRPESFVPFGSGHAHRCGSGGEAARDFSRGKPGRRLRVAAFHGAPPLEPGSVQPGRARGNHCTARPRNARPLFAVAQRTALHPHRGCGQPRDPSGGHRSGCADASPAGDRTLRGLSVPHPARVAGPVMEAAARSLHALGAREPDPTCRRVRAHRRLRRRVQRHRLRGGGPGRAASVRRSRSWRDMHASIWMR